jgi:diguanylate cyclase (GGDEF)-like protein
MAYTVQAAVVFNDHDAAMDALTSIGTQEGGVRAVVMDREGRVLATWRNVQDRPSSPLSICLSALFLDQPVIAPVLHDGQTIGQIRLWGSGSRLLQFTLIEIGSVVAFQSLIIVAAFFLSRRMLARIVGPLRSLVTVAHAVRTERRFNQRVPPAEIAELDNLAGDFNALLDELESWQNAVEREKAMLEHRASHDSLTGLPNRTYFERRLRRTIKDAAEAGTRVAVLYIDADQFKAINDRFGHAAGDAVLAQMASRIRAVVRAGDLVARLGGDEFAVLIAPAPPEDDLKPMIDAIRARMAEPIALPGGDRVTLSGSVGIGVFPDHGGHADALMHAADLAMYLAKRARRDGAPPSDT